MLWRPYGIGWGGVLPNIQAVLLPKKRKSDDKIASKQKKQEEILNRQKEKEEAIKKYKEKKAVKMKALSAKTRRGQPVMAGRIEMLLEQIQEQCKDD
eukprot:GFUD01123019.1.p1 GENE.GFUD01123019.1~~GFUD01123019.1.p1  ORF type:complete len:107 (+),score=34.94 GFUD01123019.1:33-323(+)